MKLFSTFLFVLFFAFTYAANSTNNDNKASSGAGKLLKSVLKNKNQLSINDGWYSENLDGQYQVYGCVVHFIKIHTIDNQPDYISFIFSNKGDNVHSNQNTAFVLMREKSKVKENINKEKQKLQKSLSSSLGKYQIIRFGSGKVEERAYLWNSKNFYYILSAPESEYVNLKIISKSIVNRRGTLYTIPVEVDKKTLLKNVKHMSNGNVVIKNIPMINQGQKGYCSPATWTRYLNYLGLYTNMYELAIGGTSAGGGTNPLKMKYTVNSIIQPYNMRARSINSYTPKISKIANYINKGIPIVWTITGHARLIIGYNKTNKTIAYSDSWGQAHKEKWIQEKEAVKLTAQYPMEVISIRD